MKQDEKNKKTTSEKPVSLNPLGFKEALDALLKVKPEEEKKEDKEKEPKK
ncbi:MAG: hypothetical protein GX432_09465 [Candidatus Atribacteria bacterium]|nr:hypothetical protein [Candidatus Atribacteria bacterium]